MLEQEMPVLKTYAEALDRALGQAGASETEAAEEARGLIAVLNGQPRLLQLLDQPAVGRDDKKALLRRVFEGRVSPVMLHLPMLLIDKNRGGSWRSVLEVFARLVEERQGIHPARVTTAVALDEAQKLELERGLERFTGKRLNIEFDQDEAIVGGVLFRYGDVMIDDTVRGAIDKMRRRLETAKVD